MATDDSAPSPFAGFVFTYTTDSSKQKEGHDFHSLVNQARDASSSSSMASSSRKMAVAAKEEQDENRDSQTLKEQSNTAAIMTHDLVQSFGSLQLDQNRRDTRELFNYHQRSEKKLQALRRERALEIQRMKRQEQVHQRRKYNLEKEEEEEKNHNNEAEHRVQGGKKRSREVDNEGDSKMKLACFEPTPPKHTRGKEKQKSTETRLMYGELLVDVPIDWKENWIVVPYPEGKRALVSSGNGKTVAYSKFGNVLKRFESSLPNGSKISGKQHQRDYCLLDCVYDAVHWTYYVLDILNWKDYAVGDCETSFRQFWLETRLMPDEMDPSTERNTFYKFKRLRPVPVDDVKQMLEHPSEYLQARGDTFNIDGLMFYHRELLYTEGETPLVGWVPANDFANLATTL